jgi:hypothetical protein
VAHFRGQLEHGLRTQPTVEMIMEQDLRGTGDLVSSDLHSVTIRRRTSGCGPLQAAPVTIALWQARGDRTVRLAATPPNDGLPRLSGVGNRVRQVTVAATAGGPVIMTARSGDHDRTVR